MSRTIQPGNEKVNNTLMRSSRIIVCNMVEMVAGEDVTVLDQILISARK